MPSMPSWSAAALATLAQGQWIAGPPQSDRVVGVSIDTRTLRPAQAYVAIAGDQHDGHAYVEAALDAGASIAVIDDDTWADKLRHRCGVLKVRSAVNTLQRWAHHHRDTLAQASCLVLAVAGSNGKTTTRHLLHHVLNAHSLVGTQSPKSFNNHLGVPLTLLAARPENAYVACEIGTNHPGEIDALARVARPDAALITSIGQEHLEHFNDLAGVAKEEAALLPHVRPGGVVFAEAAAAEALAPFYNVQENVTLVPVLADRFADAIPDDFPLPGPHHRRNAAIVAAAARWMGLPDPAIRAALRTATAVEGRMQVLRYGRASREMPTAISAAITVIHDAYNANPDSMRLALDHLEAIAVPRERKAALLGDMLELGNHTPAAHADALQHARRVVADGRLWCVGERFAGGRPWSEELARSIVAALKPGDVLLLKGSRGMRLERMLPHLEGRFGPPLPKSPASP